MVLPFPTQYSRALKLRLIVLGVAPRKSRTLCVASQNRFKKGSWHEINASFTTGSGHD